MMPWHDVNYNKNYIFYFIFTWLKKYGYKITHNNTKISNKNSNLKNPNPIAIYDIYYNLPWKFITSS